MSGYVRIPTYDYEYERELCERFHARVPEKVFDAHFHMSADEIPYVLPEDTFETWRQDSEFYLGKGRLKGGLMMGNPKIIKSKAELDEERLFGVEESAKHPGYVSGLLVRPLDDPSDVEEWLRKYPHIVALKPYRNYAISSGNYEADIFQYAPEWMWELAEKYGLVMMIHLSHYRDMLKDPRNGEQIRYFSKKYHNAKIILAHCAMGHHPDKLKSGLPFLDGLSNVWVDCSGISEPLSIYYCLKALSPERMLYGSDGHRFALGNNGRVMSVGGNFLGLYPGCGIELPPDYQYLQLTNFCEGLNALFAAGDIYGLTDGQWEDIFYNNSANLMYPIVRKE